MRVRNIFICAGVVFCASSRTMKLSLSVRPRMNASGDDLDDVVRHHPRQPLGVHHVVERVEQRTQVRIDLLLERAGQKAEALAGLDRGARQDDAADLLVEERAHRERHRQVGLSGTGGPDGEHDVVRADHVDIALLGGSLRRDRLAGPRRDDRLAEHGADRLLCTVVALEQAHRANDVVGGQRLAVERQLVELLERGLRGLGRDLVALDRDLVAAQVHLGPCRTLDQLEPAVVAPTQRLERLGIIECEFLAMKLLCHDGMGGIARGMQPGSSLARLVEIMDRLLGPDGCPWDREQTLDSLRPFLVEETYEVLDALARENPADHCEELGDLLMQVVFQAALRRDQGHFDIDAVVASISEKLIRRHPHVFAKAEGVDTAEKVLAQWDQIKQAEKADKAGAADKKARVLDGVPHGPALARAQKLGHRCGKIGFDWPGWEGSFAKVEEEVREVREAITAKAPAEIHAEIGDLLLAVVNLSRKLGVDAENALVDATQKFQRRFEIVEDLLAERGKTPQQSSLEEMDGLWDRAKITLRGK